MRAMKMSLQATIRATTVAPALGPPAPARSACPASYNSWDGLGRAVTPMTLPLQKAFSNPSDILNFLTKLYADEYLAA
jgi:hypothetical protein